MVVVVVVVVAVVVVVVKISDHPRPEAEYVQLMHDFGQYSGFEDLKKTVIVERLV